MRSSNIAGSHLSSPLHLQVGSAPRGRQIISMREHRSQARSDDPTLPLVVITYHPGFAAGSYEDRDYFELLTPLLFENCSGCCRLRVFTLNHPGYDLPDGYKVDRVDMAAYSIRRQPLIIDQVLRWLMLRHFAEEDEIFLLPYGHSMGGLALAQTDLQPLRSAVARQGRRLTIQKVLSAPALTLHENAKKHLRQLNALKAIKRAFSRVPLYSAVSKGLFHSLAPLLYRREAETYSLNPDCTFLDFTRYDPFVLLEQGLELLNLDYDRDQLLGLLDGSHLILCDDDGMVDNTSMLRAAYRANGNGASVKVHSVRSSHNAERDDPHLITNTLCTVMHPLVNAGAQPVLRPAAY